MRVSVGTLFVVFVILTLPLTARPGPKGVSKVLKVTGAGHKLTPGANGGSASFVTYFAGRKTIRPARIAASPEGGYYIAGSVTWEISTDAGGDTDVFLAKLDAAGELLYTIYFGGDGTDTADALAVDASGRAYVAGFTNSENFPSVNAYQREKNEAGDAFACRLTPNGGFDYCTYLGGGRDDHAWAVAVDASGAAYLAGTTFSEDFPVTPGAFQMRAQPWDSFRRPSDAFVTKLSPDGQSLAYSTYLGGKSVDCLGGSRCIPAASHDNARTIAVDSGGNAYVAGTTNSSDFPTTEGAYQRECHCDYFSSDLFVTKLNPTGAGLVYSTYLGGRAPLQMMPEESLGAMALNGAGEVYLTGGTGSLAGGGGGSFPTTAGVYQPEVTLEYTGHRVPVPFVTKLNRDGSALVYSTFLTGPSGGMANGLAIGPDGGAYLTGAARAPDFPVTKGGFANGREFHSRLSADGAALVFSTQLPAGFGAKDLALDAGGRFCLLGESGYLSCTPANPAQLPPILGVANSARSAVTGRVSGGELVTLLGPAVGPEEPAFLQIGENGKVTSEIGDTRVLFDGVPAPMIYAQQDAINCVVPAILSSAAPVLEVVRAGEVAATLRLTRVSAQPGVFRQAGSQYAAAINQNGTVHAEENPAPEGSIVAIYATGLGSTLPRLDDGAVLTENLPQVAGKVRVLDINGGGEMEIVYAGQAPGMVAGVMQVNFRLTPERPLLYPTELQLYLEVDGLGSEPFSIAAVP